MRQVELLAFALRNNIDDEKNYDIGGKTYSANDLVYHNQSLRAVRVEWLEYLKHSFRPVLSYANVHKSRNPTNCVNFCEDDSYEMLTAYSATVSAISSVLVKAFFHEKSGLMYKDDNNQISCLLLPDAIGKFFTPPAIILLSFTYFPNLFLHLP